jgi:hypothetical protein
MVSQTPRFNLDKYSQGEDNWSHSDTVDLLDELAVETDVIANRSTSGNYDDELFYATDQKLLYRWDTDQTDWLIEGGLGSSGNRLPSLWANTVNSNVTKHATDISEDYTVDSGEGAVFAGPVTGTGSISGNGKISVIQEGHQFTDNVDAQGNDLNNVGSLNAEIATIDGTDPVSSGPVGDSGQYVPLLNLSSDLIDVSVTSTSFTDILPQNLILAQSLNQSGLPDNIDGVAFSLGIRKVESPAGETIDVAVRGTSGSTRAEVYSLTDSVVFDSGSQIIDVPFDFGNGLTIESRVSGGTGSVLGVPNVTVWGKKK